ncbi:hypothetical protein BO78DRAFT_387889 [Aspergillus sclerotiicarbonarius CBS 121057]|uniref:Zn(2)-C6 fungal-type domain-containing protein n=1 Tax=Aspergillus sclerotiicarbonarius (strain CBS 121057 / IBT 28362) TaxID=1448318 RepID=A0A319E530_ASPSB|nr:hypothetical protein BO78DRAFT_387889 [Aspergillus sclerotiicarbonarius CBS 121057]
MVYRGKPGLGCQLCRKRRLTCDRREPSCSQCLRVNQECSGYRDPNTLRILDQSQEVAVKAQARRTATKSPSPDQSRSTPPPLVAPPMSPDEPAIAYVFTYYVGTGQNQGLLAYLSDILQVNPSPALQATIKAVGLASLSRRPESRRLAWQEYAVALRATNDALRDPLSVKSNSTLGAVLLLSTYEMITSNPADRLRSWQKHVNGATKLLELRGMEQLNSRPGLELFTLVRMQNVGHPAPDGWILGLMDSWQAISNIFYRSVSHNTPWMAALSKAARSKRSEHFQAIEDLYDLLIRLSDLSLRVHLARAHHNPVRDLQQLIPEALLLDADVESWRTSLSPFWRYFIVDDSQPGFKNCPHFPKHCRRYHVYYNGNLASLWNNYRLMRIVVNEMIRKMSLSLWEQQKAPECQQMVYRSVAIMKELVDDICASVPYHFTSGETAFGAVIRTLWPLFIAGNSSGANSATREHIAQMLEVIGDTAGLQQALSMARLLRNEGMLDVIPGS